MDVIVDMSGFETDISMMIVLLIIQSGKYYKYYKCYNVILQM